MSHRAHSEDALKYIYKTRNAGRHVTLEGVAGTLLTDRDEAARLLTRMQSAGLVEQSGGDIALTPTGTRTALHVIRAHRLLERYLADETGFDEETWHGRADELEHSLSPIEANNLSSRLGNPTYDPHGDPIPTSQGELVPHGGRPLSSMPAGFQGRIVHLEDEPELLFAQLVAEGLYPGMPVRVVEISPERVRFWANGDEHVLAPIVANNVSVIEEKQPEESDVQPISLSSLQVGEAAIVSHISPACRGRERRRFLDLGILPGTRISAEFRSPSGDPVAYRIRGALIALRNGQAMLVKISSLSSDSRNESATALGQEEPRTAG
jgi:DtxR family Mn-dependent transcriptional regulator